MLRTWIIRYVWLCMYTYSLYKYKMSNVYWTLFIYFLFYSLFKKWIKSLLATTTRYNVLNKCASSNKNVNLLCLPVLCSSEKRGLTSQREVEQSHDKVFNGFSSKRSMHYSCCCLFHLKTYILDEMHNTNHSGRIIFK